MKKEIKKFIKEKARFSKKETRRQWLLIFVSAVVMGISYPPFPIPFPLLIFAGLVPFLFVIEKRTRLAQLNRAAFMHGLIFSLISVYWIGAWTEGRDMFLMIGGIGAMLINASVFMIATTLYYFGRRVFGGTVALALFPIFWVTYEYFYMITDLCFPWLTTPNALPYFKVFLQGIDIVGVLGLSLIIVYINYFIFRTVKSCRTGAGCWKRNVIVAAVLFLIPLVYGIIRENTVEISEDTVRVGLIQPDLDPYDKWSAGTLEEILDMYLDLSEKAAEEGAEIVIWPETSLPVYLMNTRYFVERRRIHNFIRKYDVHLLTGMPDVIWYTSEKDAPFDAKKHSSSGRYYSSYNSLLFFSPYTMEVKKYKKMKLVPFSERTPFVDQLPFIKDLINWGVGISYWNRGKDTTLFTAHIKREESEGTREVNIGGVICFESVFPLYVSAFTGIGADFISVVTNDSWYGDVSGPYQHKGIAVLRAIESRRSVVRAANGGISSLILADGETIAETDMYEKTYLVVDVPLQNQETFFVNNRLMVPGLLTIIAAMATGLFIITRLYNLIRKD